MSKKTRTFINSVQGSESGSESRSKSGALSIWAPASEPDSMQLTKILGK